MVEIRGKLRRICHLVGRDQVEQVQARVHSQARPIHCTSGGPLVKIIFRDADPDPAFQVNQDPIRIKGFDDKKLKKKIQQKFLFYFVLIKNCNLLMSKLQEKPSAFKSEHLALQNDIHTM
jgi:hypothetical protein